MPITVHSGSEWKYILVGRYSSPASTTMRAARAGLSAITLPPSEGNQESESAHQSNADASPSTHVVASRPVLLRLAVWTNSVASAEKNPSASGEARDRADEELLLSLPTALAARPTR